MIRRGSRGVVVKTIETRAEMPLVEFEFGSFGPMPFAMRKFVYHLFGLGNL